MKAIKVNTAIDLNNGLQIPPGAIVTINEGLAQPFRQFVDDNQSAYIPGQIAVSTYVSKIDYESGKNPVPPDSISQYQATAYVAIPLNQYQTVPAESMLVAATLTGLNQIYPGQCEVIEVIPPLPEFPTIEAPFVDQPFETPFVAPVVVPEPTPEPIIEPISEPTPEPTLEPIIEPIPEPIPEPILEPTPEPPPPTGLIFKHNHQNK